MESAADHVTEFNTDPEEADDQVLSLQSLFKVKSYDDLFEEDLDILAAMGRTLTPSEPSSVQDSAEKKPSVRRTLINRKSRLLSITPEVSLISPKQKLRLCVKKIILAQRLQRHTLTEHKKSSQEDIELQHHHVFDKSLYKAGLKYRKLTEMEKNILEKASKDRSKLEIRHLQDLMKRMHSFKRLDDAIKEDMLRILRYQCFKKNEMIVKQGEEATDMYYIVSGKVQFRVKVKDKAVDNEREVTLTEMWAGSSFGELALTQHSFRPSSVYAIEETEVVRVNKHEFEAILEGGMEREWYDRLAIMKALPYLSKIRLPQLIEYNNHCRIVQHPRGSLIIGDTAEEQDKILFIVSGFCKLIKQVDMLKEIVYPRCEKLRLLDTLTATERKELDTWLLGNRKGRCRFTNPKTYFLTSGPVTRGFIAGVGEDLTKTYIIAHTEVEILEGDLFYLKLHQGSHINRMKKAMNKAIPTSLDLFRDYEKITKWVQYKQSLTEETKAGSKREQNTVVVDVPMDIRGKSIRHRSIQQNLHFIFLEKYFHCKEKDKVFERLTPQVNRMVRRAANRIEAKKPKVVDRVKKSNVEKKRVF